MLCWLLVVFGFWNLIFNRNYLSKCILFSAVTYFTWCTANHITNISIAIWLIACYPVYGTHVDQRPALVSIVLLSGYTFLFIFMFSFLISESTYVLTLKEHVVVTVQWFAVLDDAEIQLKCYYVTVRKHDVYVFRGWSGCVLALQHTVVTANSHCWWLYVAIDK